MLEAKVMSMFRVLVCCVVSIGLFGVGWSLASTAANAQGASWMAEAFGEEFDNYGGSSNLQPAPAQPRYTFGPKAFPTIMQGGPRPYVPPIVPKYTALSNSEEVGTILIDSEARKLYLTISKTEAYVYPISVGREGFDWTGTEKISRVARWPDWHPPAEMRLRDPRLPKKMHGGIKNPLGAVALYLGDTLYRIHGTNDPDTIGQAASSGCFRMLNGHAVHLARKVKIGATVKVLPSINTGPASAQLQGSTRSATAWTPTITR